MSTLHAATDPAAARPLHTESIRPVVAWAVFGAAWLALQLYTYTAWILGPNFKPAPTGDDPIPDLVLFYVRLFETLSIVSTLAVGWWLWRTCKRDGRLSIEAIVAIAWTPLWWWDGVYNWPRTLFMYNAYFVNRGNWGAEIPGWVNPTGHLLAEPILFVGLMYFYIPVAIGAIVAAVLRRSKSRWPTIGMAGLITIGLAGCMTLDLLLEAVWVHTHLYAYSGTVHAWSIWGGTTHQFPVYEAVFWGSVWASTGFLLYFRDDRGRTIVERGLERVKAARLHTPLRILAVGGFFNFMFALYSAIMWFISFSMDATPAGYPSWLRTGQCGEGTQYECPGPQVPVSLPGSKPIPPFLGSN
jgi:hypothetical protein